MSAAPSGLNSMRPDMNEARERLVPAPGLGSLSRPLWIIEVQNEMSVHNPIPDCTPVWRASAAVRHVIRRVPCPPTVAAVTAELAGLGSEGARNV